MNNVYSDIYTYYMCKCAYESTCNTHKHVNTYSNYIHT